MARMTDAQKVMLRRASAWGQTRILDGIQRITAEKLADANLGDVCTDRDGDLYFGINPAGRLALQSKGETK